ncbi:MAG TPA: cadherin-like beta sandwich domain-containing protein [Bacilli bacterium]|nr:cadherin-like beta sandwich domain-containing protein [Bacilli bacterium]
MKKIVISFLFSIFLFILFPIVTFASGTVNFDLSSPSTFYVDDELSVALTMTSIAGFDSNDYLTYLSGALTYDSTKLEYVSATADVAGLTVSKTSDGNISIQVNTSEVVIDHSMRLALLKFRGITETSSTQIKYTVTESKAGSNISILTSNNPTLNVGILKEESTNNDLELLTVKDNSNQILTLSPAFNSEVLNYELNVPYSTTYLKLTPILDDTKATYKVSGSLVLVAEENNYITITVTSESGSVKVYEIIAYRNAKISEEAALKSLSVTGYSDLIFDPGKTTYTLVYTSQEDLDEFDLEYETASDKATVVVDQPNILEDGSQIRIVVTAEDKETTTTYTLKIRLNSITTTTTSKGVTTQSSNIIGKILIGVIIVIAITIGILLYILKKGSKPKVKEKEDEEKTKIFNNEEPDLKEEKQDMDEQINEEEIDEEDSDENDESDNDEPTRIFD